MSTLTTNAGEKLRDNRLVRRPVRATPGGILPGFGSSGQTAIARDPLGGTALTMLLVLYPALACAIVAVAAFLFCNSCGTA